MFQYKCKNNTFYVFTLSLLINEYNLSQIIVYATLMPLVLLTVISRGAINWIDGSINIPLPTMEMPNRPLYLFNIQGFFMRLLVKLNLPLVPDHRGAATQCWSTLSLPYIFLLHTVTQLPSEHTGKPWENINLIQLVSYLIFFIGSSSATRSVTKII